MPVWPKSIPVCFSLKCQEEPLGTLEKRPEGNGSPIVHVVRVTRRTVILHTHHYKIELWENMVGLTSTCRPIANRSLTCNWNLHRSTIWQLEGIWHVRAWSCHQQSRRTIDRPTTCTFSPSYLWAERTCSIAVRVVVMGGRQLSAVKNCRLLLTGKCSSFRACTLSLLLMLASSDR